VVASANAGYNFVNWTEGGAVVSSSASYTFTASANRSLVANFVPTATTVTITTSASPSAGGSTSGGGPSTLALAYPWSPLRMPGTTLLTGRRGVSSSVPRPATPSSPARTAPGGELRPCRHHSHNHHQRFTKRGGTTSGGGTVNSGASVTVVATANAGYSFVNWTEGGTAVSTSASYTFTTSAKPHCRSELRSDSHYIYNHHQRLARRGWQHEWGRHGQQRR
jgi:hypothetical protein